MYLGAGGSFVEKIFFVLRLISFLILVVIVVPTSSRSRRFDFQEPENFSASNKHVRAMFDDDFMWTGCISRKWTKSTNGCSSMTRLCEQRSCGDGWEYKCCPVAANARLQSSSSGKKGGTEPDGEISLGFRFKKPYWSRKNTYPKKYIPIPITVQSFEIDNML